MRLHVSRGLWRLWLVCSILWAASWSVVFNSKYEAVRQHFDSGPANPKYKPCFSFKTPSSISVDELNEAFQCAIALDQREVLQTASLVILGVPVFCFVLGYAAIWIGRGFVRTPT